MTDWVTFLDEAPDRVVEVIEDGPRPLSEYGGSKLSWPDKMRGLMRFKGDTTHKPKRGYKAVVYFDPAFCQGEYQLNNVPDSVREKHEMTNVIQEFEEL